MSIASKLEYLDGTKDYIRQCIQQKGVTVPANTTFRQYGDKILEIDTEKHPDGGEGGGTGTGKLTVGTATATGQDYILNPPEEYDGFSAVNVTGDYNLKPENIAEGITIYGVTGTMQVPRNTSIIPSAYLDLFEEAKKHYDGDYKNLMILESNDTVAFGFMLDGFNVDDYDSENTEFYASKWVYVAYNKSTGAWKVEPWENSTSNGNSYIRNVRYSDTYIYYGNLLIYPMMTPGVGSSLETDTLIMAVKSTVSFVILGINVDVDWGDNSDHRVVNNSASTTTLSHSYANDDEEYTITIKGSIYKIYSIKTQSLRFLTPLPSTILDVYYLCNASSPNYAGLESVPSNLFSKIRDPSLFTIGESMFAYQTKLTFIPEGLFDRLEAMTSVVSVFSNCSYLSAIPSDLFYNMPNLTTIASAFSRCSILSEIPKKLFSKCKKITRAGMLFYGCSYISSIPDELFAPDCESMNMELMFAECTGLKYVSDNFFLNLPNPSNIENMFRHSGLLYIPDIWNESKFGTKFTSIPHSACFQTCTSASNYNDVPQGWK